MILLYRLLLRLFPTRDYAAHRSRPWGWFFRFDICDEGTGELYLRRFVLARAPFGSLYLHHIVRSDADHCLHDHPWNCLIAVLWAGYVEQFEDRLVTRRPGSIRWMPAPTRHRVMLHPKGERELPAWTLCLTGRKVREWGFWQRGAWVQWRSFLDGDREC